MTHSDTEGFSRGESRWPMAIAVVACAVLQTALPASLRPAQGWWLWAFVVALLGLLIIGDPGRIDRPNMWLQITTGVLIGVVTVANAWSAINLVTGILDSAPYATTASLLLLYGGVTWLVNVIAFGLWFWALDGGGPARRALGIASRPAFLFPEMTNPHLVGEDWYPKFIDYFSLAFSTATAFSPADVSPLRPWAKLLMALEAAMSLTLGAVVIASAINALS
jgi:hypothetical protein